MKKNYLFDIDGLLQVLQAIKDGKPVEYRQLEEPDWRDFNPEEYDIDTENCKYRVKPYEYGDHVGATPIRIEDLEEDVIYLVKHKDSNENDEHLICVKSNLWRWNKIMSLHFSWYNHDGYATLHICDSDAWDCNHSEDSLTFANVVSPSLCVYSFMNVEFYQASQAQVKMIEARLREIDYEFVNGKMQQLNGNKA